MEIKEEEITIHEIIPECEINENFNCKENIKNDYDYELSNNSTKIQNPNSKKFKKFKCDFCDRKYKDLLGLKLHIQSVHEGQKYKCDLCEKVFAQPGSLDNHKKSFHRNLEILKNDDDTIDENDENNKFIECEECDKKFTRLVCAYCTISNCN